MAAQHIDSMDVLVNQFIGPICKCRTVFLLDSVNQKARQEEVIGQITKTGHLFINFFFIACMDFRQQSQAIRFCQFSDLFQGIPCFWFIHEVMTAGRFRRISKRVQANNRSTVTGQLL